MFKLRIYFTDGANKGNLDHEEYFDTFAEAKERYFVQSLVRCARDLAVKFNLIDLMKYVRCELWMTPAVKEIRLWKEDLSENAFLDICEALEVDEEEISEMENVTFKVICEES